MTCTFTHNSLRIKNNSVIKNYTESFSNVKTSQNKVVTLNIHTNVSVDI
jgi:hypothetical protein